MKHCNGGSPDLANWMAHCDEEEADFAIWVGPFSRFSTVPSEQGSESNALTREMILRSPYVSAILRRISGSASRKAIRLVRSQRDPQRS